MSGIFNTKITKREKEVIELLAEGYGTAQIALKLGISKGTVLVHKASIYSKCDGCLNTILMLRYFYDFVPKPVLNEGGNGVRT